MSYNNDMDINWKDQYERIFIEWADKALCYKWLHRKSHDNYNRYYQMFTIPVIIMSTLTGTANFAQDKVPPEYRSMTQMIIGGVNIFAGILTTVSQFLKINEMNEGHRTSAILWDRFYRIIKIELSKSRNDRVPVLSFLKKCQEQCDSLMETSPDIDEAIVTLFKKSFKTIDVNYRTLQKPDICNELTPTFQFLAKEHDIKNVNSDQNMSCTNLSEKISSEKVEVSNQIDGYIKKYIKSHKKLPSKDAVISNINDIKLADDIDLIYDIASNKYNKIDDTMGDIEYGLGSMNDNGSMDDNVITKD